MTKVKFFFKSIYENYGAAILAGIFVGTSYIPLPPWALLFCYLPLWLQVSEAESLKRAFSLSWVTQFITTLIGFYWIVYMANTFGKLPWIAAFFATLFFAAFAHFYIPLSSMLAWWISQKLNLSRVQSLFIQALSLLLFERFWPSIFPWHLGYTLLWSRIPIFHLADLVGFEGLSALILFLQAAIGAFYLQKNRDTKIIGALGIAVVILTLNFWGLSKAKHWHNALKNSDFSLNVGIVQPNIANMEEQYAKYGSFLGSKILQNYLFDSRKLISSRGPQEKKIDLLLWPESAMPFNLDAAFLNNPTQSTLLTEVRNMNTALFTGAFSQDLKQKSPLGGPLTFNSSFLLTNEGRVVGHYEKTILLAFGEYLPLGETFPFLFKLFPFTGHFGRGPGPSALILPHPQGELRLGPQICYESLFPEFSRGLAEKNIDLIVNVTNDSWYGPFSEQYQHLTMTLARAIEIRRPLVRSTNTGFSAVILADGTLLERSPYDSPWAGAYKVPILKSAETTFFVKYGHWDFVFWILLIGGIVFSLKSKDETQ